MRNEGTGAWPRREEEEAVAGGDRGGDKCSVHQELGYSGCFAHGLRGKLASTVGKGKTGVVPSGTGSSPWSQRATIACIVPYFLDNKTHTPNLGGKGGTSYSPNTA